MTANNSDEARDLSVDIICDNPDHLKKFFKDKTIKIPKSQLKLDSYFKEYKMPRHHPVLDEDLSDREFEILKKAWKIQPSNYEELVSLEGMGPKKIRALALISDLVYGFEPSWRIQLNTVSHMEVRTVILTLWIVKFMIIQLEQLKKQ